MKILRGKRGLTASLFLVAGLMIPGSAQNSGKLVGSVVDIDGPRLYTNRLQAKGWYQAFPGMKAFLSERLRTDNKTQAVVEFLVGGRAGIGRNTMVEIVTPKDVSKVGSTMRVDAGTFWAKLDKQEKPFQIQTAGGVIGIEGTELLVAVDEKGVTEVLLFEGQVSLTDQAGNSKTLAPGDYAQMGGPSGTCVLSYPAASLRTLIVERYPAFSSFLASQNVTSIPNPASPTLVRGFNQTRPGLLEALGQARDLAEVGPTGLEPNGSTLSGAPPTFRWQPVAGADSYALFLSNDQGLTDLEFSTRVEGTSLSVPEGTPGLEQGRYYWAVVALDKEGKPIGSPAQSTFETPGWVTPATELPELIGEED